MDEVKVVEASLTVVLDIMHPPWDLEERDRRSSAGEEDGTVHRFRALRTAGSAVHICSGRMCGRKMLLCWEQQGPE